MNHAGAVLGGSIRRVLRTQLVLTVAVAVGCLAWYRSTGGIGAALAAAYGGGVALVGTWLLARRVRRVGVSGGVGASAQLGLYAGAAPRFVATLALLAAGIGWMKLAPAPLIVAFGLGQLGFLINSGTARRKHG